MPRALAWALVGVLTTVPLHAQQLTMSSRERGAIIATVEDAKKNVDRARAEHVLRGALQRWPEDTVLESYLAALLFATERLDESYEHMTAVCTKSGFEGACASSVGIDLVRNRWSQAMRTTTRFSETACQRSDRLWTLKQLGRNPEQAVTVGRRLVMAEPDKETSYLFLAAAQWRAGQRVDSQKTLAMGKVRATQVVLLREPIDWNRDER